VSELHTHQLLSDDTGTETIEPEETIISDEKPHEIAEKSFADFSVRADIVESLADAGITHPFPIQAMTLPVALSGQDGHRQDPRLRHSRPAARSGPG
jgi:superfamily II DNA/RNA helicase